MNAYLFSSDATISKMDKAVSEEASTGALALANQYRNWDVCVDTIVIAETPEAGEALFRQWLTAPKEDSTVTEIRQVTAAQFFDQLLTEAGPAPLDWPSISEAATTQAETLPADDSEQGYWVDVNTVFNRGVLPPNVEELRAALAPDFTEGLNWAGDRTFYFIIGVLRPRPARPEKEGLPFYEDSQEEGQQPAAEDIPEIIERECAAMVRARNSVVAAWLWKRFSASMPVANNEIQIVPWCGAMGFGNPNP